MTLRPEGLQVGLIRRTRGAQHHLNHASLGNRHIRQLDRLGVSPEEAAHRRSHPHHFQDGGIQP